MDECIINCVDEISARYDTGLCAPVFRKYGYSKIVLFKCGLSFTDMLDPTEWTTKILAGDIIVGPLFGNFVPGETTSSTIPDGCGTLYTEYAETPWTFSTPSTAEDYTDEDWWSNFNKNAMGYTFGYLNCEGRLYLNDEAVTIIKAAQAVPGVAAVTNPGLQISLSSIPTFKKGPNGDGKAGIWEVSGKFIHASVFRSVEIPGLSL